MADEAPIPEPTVPEPAQEAPAPVETPTPTPAEPTAPETQTAQIPASEPLPPEPEPIHAPESPQAASAPAPVPTRASRDLLVKARATIQDRKHKKLEKILELLNTKGKITNDEVEKLLHVSDATATRYLSALEKEGKIKQVGKTGKAVQYERS